MATFEKATPSAVILHAEAKTEKKMPKARNFCFTLNEISKWGELQTYFQSLKTCNYYVGGHEIAPTTGHEHIQGYVQFTNAISLSIKKLCGAHIEVCKGTPQQNYAYCTKDKKFDEWGKLRISGGTRIKDIKEMSKDEREDLPCQYYNIIKKINEEEDADLDIDDWFKDDLKVLFIYGRSGMGKSKRAYEELKKRGIKKFNEIKFDGKYWHGIGKAESAIYDDFRDSHMTASEFINFIDYNKHILNTKGGSRRNEYKLIIITSIQDPNDIYKNVKGEPREQWLRRLEIINLGGETIPRPKIKFPEIEFLNDSENEF